MSANEAVVTERMASEDRNAAIGISLGPIRKLCCNDEFLRFPIDQAHFSQVLARIIGIFEIKQLRRLSGSKPATNIQADACSRHHISRLDRRNRCAGGRVPTVASS